METAQRLRYERELHGWSQSQVARKLNTAVKNVGRWERGEAVPSPYFREQLCTLFGKDAYELGFASKAGDDATTQSVTPVIEVEQSSASSSTLLDPAIPQPVSIRLVGRAALLQHLKQQLFSVHKKPPFLALSGLPGVGKTTLALALAHDTQVQKQFADGILWAGLGPSPNLLAILSRWGTLLGIAATEGTKERSREEWADLLHRVIGTRRMLLVLDDAWTMEDVLALRVAGPRCASVITTRVPVTALRVSDEGVVTVPELSEDDSVQLLAHYIPDLVARERNQVLPLVHAAGQLPLALMLMGRYLRVQGQGGQPRRIHTALTRLSDAGLRLHLQEPQALTNRHPSLPIETPVSLHSIIAVSDQQLDEQTRLALYDLSIFPPKPNSFSEEAALAVAATSEEVLDQLSDAGLLESSGPGRYSLHQTIADYATTCLHGKSNLHRLVSYFVWYVEAYQQAYAELERESENILTALQKAYEEGLHKELVRCVIAFFPYLLSRGLYGLAQRYLERANEAARANNDLLGTINILLRSARVLEPQGNYSQIETFLLEALTLARQIHHQERLCACLARLGGLYYQRGNYAQARTYLLEGREIARQIENRDHLSAFLNDLSMIAYQQGNYSQAESYMQEGLLLARQLHHRERESALLSNLGAIVYEQGQWTQAESYFQEALALARQLGHREYISTLLVNLGEVAQKQGDLNQAETYYEEGLVLARQLQLNVLLLSLLTNLGTIATKQGNYAQAEAYLQEGLDAAYQIGNPKATSALLLTQGELLLKQRHLEEAAASFQKASNYIPEGQQDLTAQVEYGLARVAFEQGNFEEAHRLGKASLLICEQIGYYMTAEVKEWLWKTSGQTTLNE